MSIKYDKKTKTYFVRVSYKDPISGKYRTKSKYNFKRKKDAAQWESEKKVALESGINIGKNPPFIDVFFEWYKTYKENKISASTKMDYEDTHNKIKKYFKKTPIKSINRIQIQSFLNWLGTEYIYHDIKGLARSTNRKTHNHIKSFAKAALHDGLIHRDFTHETFPIGRSSEPIKYLSQKETKKLLSALNDDYRNRGIEDYYNSRWMIRVSLFTGLPYEEVAGLTYDSLDDVYLSVTKAWDMKKKKFKKTKRPSRLRTIKIEDRLSKSLKSLIIRKKEQELAQKITNPYNLIFCQYDGTAPNNSSVNKSLEWACKRAKIKTITFHELRHTHASLLIYEGMDITSISKRLGHANPKVTLGYYSHVIDELDNRNEQISDQAMKNILR